MYTCIVQVYIFIVQSKNNDRFFEPLDIVKLSISDSAPSLNVYEYNKPGLITIQEHDN